MSVGATERPWELAGAAGETILGDVHRPVGEARGTLLICHGFMGYKDYGLMPLLADAAAKRGWVAHRFNFSHSGMTHRLETFERDDLFARDTWRKQAIDLRTVLVALRSGELDGGGRPVVVFGHSRGGVTALLTTRWMLDENDPALPDALVTAASPSASHRVTQEQAEALREAGYLERKSGRTGQTLKIDRRWLDEQHDDPDWHAVLTAAGRVAVAELPWLILHGSGDDTVPLADGEALLEASGGRAELRVVDGASHTFDCPNPAPREVTTVNTRRLIEATLAFAGEVRDRSVSAGE
ncbi:MAG: alpha/beta fold hydrolase [Planctomycetota bacterium]